MQRCDPAAGFCSARAIDPRTITGNKDAAGAGFAPVIENRPPVTLRFKPFMGEIEQPGNLYMRDDTFMEQNEIRFDPMRFAAAFKADAFEGVLSVATQVLYSLMDGDSARFDRAPHIESLE